MAQASRRISTPKIAKKSINSWKSGLINNRDIPRTPDDGLINLFNCLVEQDGTIRPAPSLIPYGAQPIGTVLGEIFEVKYSTLTTTTTYMVSMQVVGGIANVYIARGEDKTWTKISGKNYDTTARAHYLQIQNKVVVMNGVDTLSAVDLSTMTIIPWNELPKPPAPTLLANNVTGTNFIVYYAITVNSTVGETEGSNVLSVNTVLDRSLWNPDTQNVQIERPTIANISSWNVYMGTSANGAGQPTLYCIASGLNASSLKFVDNGTAAQDISRPLPVTNSTKGPKAKRGTVINNRVWLIGEGYDVWRGGDYGYELDFSAANGGGRTPVGNGTADVPVAIASFRTGKSDPCPVVLAQGTNGNGKRFFLSPETVTYGSSVFVVWKVEEDTGTDGTDAPDSVVIYNNSIYYLSRDGFKTTGTLPQLQTILSTRRMSNTIQDAVYGLNTRLVESSNGVAYEGRLYWAVPSGTSYNNEIWVCDIERGGAWTKLLFPADWIFLYSDNVGLTHFCLLKDNKLFEFSRSRLTSNNGIPFSTGGSSGFQYFSEDTRDQGQLLVVVFTLERPRGEITLGVTTYSDDSKPQTFIENRVFIANETFVGWGEPSRSGITAWGQRGWGQVESTPEELTEPSVDVVIEIDEEAKYYSWFWSSNGEADYQLSRHTAQFVNIGTQDIT